MAPDPRQALLRLGRWATKAASNLATVGVGPAEDYITSGYSQTD